MALSLRENLDDPQTILKMEAAQMAADFLERLQDDARNGLWAGAASSQPVNRSAGFGSRSY